MAMVRLEEGSVHKLGSKKYESGEPCGSYEYDIEGVEV